MQHHLQSRGSAPPSSQQVQSQQAQEEIQNFLRAVDSYPERFAKEPRLSFQRYLRSFLSPPAEERGNTHRGKDESPRRRSHPPQTPAA